MLPPGGLSHRVDGADAGCLPCRPLPDAPALQQGSFVDMFVHLPNTNASEWRQPDPAYPTATRAVAEIVHDFKLVPSRAEENLATWGVARGGGNHPGVFRQSWVGPGQEADQCSIHPGGLDGDGQRQVSRVVTRRRMA